MPVKLEKNGDTLNVFLIGEIDHHSARDMRECIDTSVEMIKPKRLVLDFGGVSFMDSSGVGLVMGRYKLINFFGGSVTMRNTSPRIERILRMSGIEKIATIEKCKGEGVAV